MSQQTELEKVKGRIRALAAKTIDRGCSEAEAMIAARKVGELLEVYGLTMSEVELRDETCLQRQVTVTGPRLQAVGIIFMAVIRLTGVRGWTNGRGNLVLFGLEPDVLMGEYLLHLVGVAVDHEEAAFRASDAYRRSRLAPQQRLRSFRYGFAERVSARLDEIAAHREAAEAAAHSPGGARGSSGGTALVLAKERRIEDAFRELGIRLRSRSTTRRVSDRGAYHQGQEAGGRVSLERPVGAGAGRRVLPRG